MKKIIFLLIFLYLTSNVLASTPDFSMTELLNDELNNGISDFGDLLFIEKPYIPDYINMSSITSNSAQKYDILNWNGNFSLKITSPTLEQSILINGSSYHFVDIGTYKIESMTNSSLFDTITVFSENDNLISITDIVTSPGIELDFSTNSFFLNNEKSVSLEMNIDDDVETGIYEVKYKINGVQKTNEFKILSNVDWSMNQTNISLESTIKAGEGKYIGRIILTNNGNEDVDIVVTKSGNNTGMIGLPQPATLFRKNTLNLDFQAQVPTVMKSGLYEIKIKIVGGNISKNFIIKIKVVDAIKPVIESIDFSTDKVFVENKISVIASDNNDVTKVILFYDDKEIELKKDLNLFTKKITFDKLSRYVFKFCAEDEEGNKVCKTINKTFSKIDVINKNEKVLNMDSMKFGKYSRIYLFNVSEEIGNSDIIISVVSYETFPKTDLEPVFRIVDSDGSIKNFASYNNEVKIDSPGEYYFEVRLDSEADLDGIIRLEMGDQFETIEDMTFKVSFKDYDVPNDFTINWVNGRDMICNVKDTGNLDTSYYNCNLKYPIDTRKEDISIPTTVGEKNNFEKQADKIRDEMAKSKRNSGVVIGVMVAILIIVLLWSGFMILYYPFIRIKTGKNEVA